MNYCNPNSICPKYNQTTHSLTLKTLYKIKHLRPIIAERNIGFKHMSVTVKKEIMNDGLPAMFNLADE